MRYFTHKTVAKWLLKQQMPSQFTTSSTENEDDGGEQRNSDQDTLLTQKMRHFWILFYHHKQFHRLSQNNEIQSKLLKLKQSIEVIPIATECHICQQPLDSEVSTRLVKLVMLNRVVKGKRFKVLFDIVRAFTHHNTETNI